MGKRILIDIDVLKHIFNIEPSKLCGKCMKRFELSDNKEDIKKQVKELLYESYRDLLDMIHNCSKSEDSLHLEFDETQSKEK